MKKTFCDRCGAECDGEIQRFTIFDVNKSIDVCDNCYRAFFQWLQSGNLAFEDCPDGEDGEDCPDDKIKECNGCIYHHLGWHQEPCEQCIRKRYIFCEKIEVSDSDNYINKENNNEN